MNLSKDCLATLRAKRSALTPKVEQVAAFIIEHPRQAATKTISELAQAIGVSQFSIINCVKAAGFDNFSEFKTALAFELGSPDVLLFGELTGDESIQDIMQYNFQKKAQCIRDTAQIIDGDEFAKAVSCIWNANRIEVYGIGSSGYAADYLAWSLRRLGKNSVYYQDPNYQVMSASMLKPGDLVLSFSTSGDSASVVAATRNARENGCITVAVTSYTASKLARYSDHVLVTTYSDPELMGLSNNSIVEQNTLASAIILALAKFDKNMAITNISRSASYINRATSGDEDDAQYIEEEE